MATLRVSLTSLLKTKEHKLQSQSVLNKTADTLQCMTAGQQLVIHGATAAVNAAVTRVA